MLSVEGLHGEEIKISVRMADSQSTEPGFESSLLPIRSLGNFVLSTMPQFTQLY